MVYVDNSRPELVDGFVRKTFTAMIEGIREGTLAAEHATKNWMKIPAKFMLWFIFMAAVFMIAKKRKFSYGLRNGLLFISVLLFGVILGSDPNPMGTVKDAIRLYGFSHAVFPPQIIALTIFLAIVLLTNKSDSTCEVFP
jgi:hypothetical protein